MKRRELHDHRCDLTRFACPCRGRSSHGSPAQRQHQPTTQSPWPAGWDDLWVQKTPDRRPSYDELAALVVRQMATIEAQRETIAQLEATVGRLSARVAELERRQSRN